MIKDIIATVKYKEFIGDKYVRLGVGVGWDEFVPGQFVMTEIPGHEVFLRRPFGIVGVETGVLEICFKIVGKGTLALSKISQGDQISILGPLGTGFSISKDLNRAILVAGGYGIAPLFSLYKQLINQNKKVVLYYGAKSSSDFLYLDELKSHNVDIRLTTEDGSSGEKGLITERFSKELIDSEGTAIFTSGPNKLLLEVAKIARDKKIPAQVSLDRYMACGLGVCLGCMVGLNNGLQVRACREGPVFDAENIQWDF